MSTLTGTHYHVIMEAFRKVAPPIENIERRKQYVECVQAVGLALYNYNEKKFDLKRFCQKLEVPQVQL